MPTPDVTTDILVALGTGVVLLFLAKLTDKGKTGDGTSTADTPPYQHSDVDRIWSALDMFLKLPIPSEQSQIDAVQAGVARLIKSATSDATTEKVNQIADMAAEAMYDVQRVQGAFENETFFDTPLDITKPLEQLGVKGATLAALTSAELDNVLGEVVNAHKQIEAALQAAGTTIEPRDKGSPISTMRSEIPEKKKKAIEKRESNYGDERLVTQLLPVMSVQQLVDTSTKATLSTIFGDIDTAKQPLDLTTNTYFVLASTDDTDMLMYAWYWSDNTVISYTKDAHKFYSGHAGVQITSGNARLPGLKKKYRAIVPDGTGNLDRAVKKGQVWVHIWEVPKADINHINAAPPTGGKPHPWEYAFKSNNEPPLTPDQLTFMWSTMAARGLTDATQDIIYLLDRDVFSSYIANFRL